MGDGRRLFVGVRVSVACANTLTSAAETLARRARDSGLTISWVAPASYHVTLKYLGWTRDDAVGAVRDAVGAAVRGTPELKFRVSRLGGFASTEAATVLWAGVENPGSGALGDLAARIDAATVAIGCAPADFAFHPHVTLGRLRDPRSLRELILPMSEQMFSETRVDAVLLLESEAKPGGSLYREVARISFNPAPEAGFAESERQTQPVQLGATHADVPRSNAIPDIHDRPDVPDTDDGWPRGQGP